MVEGYRGRDPKLHRDVALEILPEAFALNDSSVRSRYLKPMLTPPTAVRSQKSGSTIRTFFIRAHDDLRKERHRLRTLTTSARGGSAYGDT